MSAVRCSGGQPILRRTTKTTVRRTRFVVDRYIGSSIAMKLITTPVMSAKHPGPAPIGADPPSVRRRPEAVTWLVAQLHWERHLEYLRRQRDVGRGEVPPTVDVAPAIQSIMSSDRAVRSASYAGPAHTDRSTASGRAHTAEMPVVIAAPPSRTQTKRRG
jgi:hypothetical protein